MTDYAALFAEHPFRFYRRDCILEEKDLGICADIAALRTPEYSVAAAEGFQGCPYTDTAFRFDVRVGGERVHTEDWQWLPNAMARQGSTRLFTLETVTAVVPASRTFVMKLTCVNRSGDECRLPVQVMFRGAPRYESNWEFSIPAPGKKEPGYSTENGKLICRCGENGFVLTSSLSLTLFPQAYLWEGEIVLPPSAAMTFWFSCSMGRYENAKAEADNACIAYDEKLEDSFMWLLRETDRLRNRLPSFSSSEPALDRLYVRSLVSYLLCRWDNPDLCTVPFFSTGSINGACMCSYLWNYCGGLMLHPVYDEAGNSEMLKAYLRNDLTTSYALNPVTSGKVGPWYPVNQEKIICMVYYHVLFTGNRDFLFEQAGDHTVLEWMIYHAYVADDPEKSVELFDYGVGGNSHLELRKQYVYNGIMPDLNARRYMNYQRVYELTKLAGCPDERLPQRMEQLKEAMKSLWNDETCWYDFIRQDGVRDTRYTVQMFKFLNSPVIGQKERAGLISHLNEREFLSAFGLHSMSKLDEAYDQDDIDNGGGGICPHFTAQICSQLYETGYEAEATDIVRRILWWGERFPYLGDSVAANMIANREDTPLQGDISSAGIAQMIFFYMFGIHADFNGTLTVSPARIRPAKRMKIENARLCGKVFSVEVDEDRFRVTFDGRCIESEIGEPVRI